MENVEEREKEEETNSRVTTSRVVRAQNLDIYVDFVDFYSSLFDIQRDATSRRDGVVRDVKTRSAGFRIQLVDRRENPQNYFV